MTTFKTSANGQNDSFPGFGLSGLQAMGIGNLLVRSGHGASRGSTLHKHRVWNGEKRGI